MDNALMKEFEQLALAAFEKALAPYGFKHETKKTEQHFCEMIFVHHSDRYVKISANSHPRDYPPYFNIVLGEGSREFVESDWNSIALWRLKNLLTSTNMNSEYKLVASNKLPKLLAHATAELLEYGKAFLVGDVTMFRQARSEQNKDRTPYKVYSPDKNGKYTVTDEPESAKMKKKYS